MVMINIGDDVARVKEMLTKSYDAMRYVVHDMTEFEETMYESILAQLIVELTNAKKTEVGKTRRAIFQTHVSDYYETETTVWSNDTVTYRHRGRDEYWHEWGEWLDGK